MKIKIDIDSDNDSCRTLADAQWLLEKITQKVRNGVDSGLVKDINGNKVGTFEIQDFCEDTDDEVNDDNE